MIKKKLHKLSAKSLLAVIVVVIVATISCTNSDESHQSNQSEIHPGAGNAGDTTAISQPTGLSTRVVGPTSVHLTWNAVPGATAYWIYRGTYVPAIVAKTNYTDKSLKADTTYTYAIAAVVNGTLGPKSASATVTTPR